MIVTLHESSEFVPSFNLKPENKEEEMLLRIMCNADSIFKGKWHHSGTSISSGTFNAKYSAMQFSFKRDKKEETESKVKKAKKKS